MARKTPSIQLPFTDEDIEKELCQRSLYQFVKAAWHTIEPHPFVDGWHIRVVCDHLEKIVEWAIQNLLLNMPPRHTKSLLVGVFWPAWVWGPRNNPESRWLCGSYAASLSIRDAVKCRRLLQSSWYQRYWGDRFRFHGDQNAKQRYENNKGGYRISTSVDGMATGEGGDYIVADDPNDVNDIGSKAAIDSTNDWWSHSISTRGDSPKLMRKVVVQQRLPNDLTSHILATTPEDYQRLVLPARYEGIDKEESTTGWKDPRTEIDELLWPQQFNMEDIRTLERQLGDLSSAQLQQRPSPLGGTIFKRHWWRYYKQQPALGEFDIIIQSWDMAFKDTMSSSYVAGQVWGVKGADRYLLDRIRARLDFVNTLEAFLGLHRAWPETRSTYIEDKANGPAIISTLKHKIAGLIPVQPEGSKISRAFAVTPDVEAGNVYLPEPARKAWITDWLKEISEFPNGTYNDETDAMTQALNETGKWIRRSEKFGELPPIISETRVSPLSGLR